MTKLTIGPESRAGWSDQPAGHDASDLAPAADRAAFATPEDERYREEAAAGRGGMGVVAMTRDRRLGRVVALKRVADDVDDDGQRARLMREASITARLEHPGVVAIHDAGTDLDGAPFYTMRLIRGESLQAALAGAPTLDARLAYLRPLLAATEAVAYAHARGIVHGDLKPGNIMVGDFGQTQVVDWGAARVLPDAEPELTSDPALVGDERDHAGTPAYMSPERARGAPSDRGSDVWALGAILFELLRGRRYAEDERRADVLAWLRGRPGSWPRWPVEVPPELAAIAARALAWEADARYRDAAALADDLRRYLDGRRVAAHAYSSLELARRLVRAWRWPIAVLIAAAAVGAIALAASWRRIERHRVRAIAAERVTARALAEADETLGAALASRAVAALAVGSVAEAEVLAAHALTRGESAAARGVLVGTAGWDHPSAILRRSLAGCLHAAPGDGEHALCLDDDGLVLWRVVPDEAPRWRHAGPALAATVLDGAVVVWTPGSELLVLELETGVLRHRVPISRPRTLTVEPTTLGREALYHSNHALFAVDVATGVTRAIGTPCGSQRIASLGVGASAIVVVCWDGAVEVGGAEGSFVRVGTSGLRAPARPATAVGVSADQRTIALGASDGSVQVIELDRWAPAPPRPIGASRIDQLRFVGPDLAVVADEGGVGLWTRDLASERGRLPVAVSRRIEVAGEELITAGAGWVRWRIPPPSLRHRVVAPAGYGTLAVAAVGGWRAAGRGDGVIDLWRDDPTVPVRQLAITDVVIKQVTFSDDGTRLGAAVAGPENLAEIAVESGAVTLLPVADRDDGCCARARLLADGTLLGFHYDDRRTRWRGAEVAVTAAPRAIDVAQVAGSDELVTLGADGGLAVERGAVRTSVGAVSGGLAVAGTAGAIAVGLRDRVEVRDRRGEVRWSATTAAATLALAFDRDGTWLAGGGSDGVIRIWSATTGALAATVPGHAGRIDALAFDGASALWSASWDGTARRWELAGLRAEPAQLVAASEARWTISLAQALAAGAASSPTIGR